MPPRTTRSTASNANSTSQQPSNQGCDSRLDTHEHETFETQKQSQSKQISLLDSFKMTHSKRRIRGNLSQNHTPSLNDPSQRKRPYDTQNLEIDLTLINETNDNLSTSAPKTSLMKFEVLASHRNHDHPTDPNTCRGENKRKKQSKSSTIDQDAQEDFLGPEEGLGLGLLHSSIIVSESTEVGRKKRNKAPQTSRLDKKHTSPSRSPDPDPHLNPTQTNFDHPLSAHTFTFEEARYVFISSIYSNL